MCRENIYPSIIHIIPKQKAKELGMKFYFTGIPCKNGHVSPRWVSSSGCAQCVYERSQREETKAYQREYHHARKDAKAAYCKEYREKNLDRLKEYDKNRYENNLNGYKDRTLERAKEYYTENREHVLYSVKCYRERNKEFIKTKSKEYYEENKTKYIIRAMERKRNLKHRSISNCYDDIKHIYEQAALLRYLGYDVHVDHVVPLNGKIVSGLHVPWNLQIIPAEENITKGNKFISYIEYH